MARLSRWEQARERRKRLRIAQRKWQRVNPNRFRERPIDPRFEFIHTHKGKQPKRGNPYRYR